MLFKNPILRIAFRIKASRHFRKVQLAGVLAVVVLACYSLFLLQSLLMPKYADDVVEGAFIAEYYGEEMNHDVIFIGDCEVYENFSPVELWQTYGINSYIRGSAEQYIWQSYYLLEDTLRYETPKAVVFNVQSLQFGESQREAYNRMTLDGMRWSLSKAKSISASLTEDEHFIDYVFPILRYHDRWSELTESDFRYALDAKKVSHNGYYMRVDTKPAGSVPEAKPLADYSFDAKAWKYLDKMRGLCAKKGITLILVKAPSLYPYWYPEWNEQVLAYANKYQLPYVNFIGLVDELGINYDTDTYDGGLHMNLSGAIKLSRYMGQVLRAFDVPDRRSDSELSAIWVDKLEFYEAERVAQCLKYGVSLEVGT